MKDYIAAKKEKEIQKRCQEDHNILGIGVGHKDVKGILDVSQMALKFFVRRKLPKKSLSRSEMLPAKVSDLPTDVVQMAALRARGSFTQRLRPGLGGCSGCVVVQNLNYTGTLGLGMRGTGGFSEKTFVLSNNHVLANENQAQIGDPVIQPGTLDGGDPAKDTIGNLFDFVPLRFATAQSTPENLVDAACAEITRFGDFSREVFWVGYPRGWRTRADIEAAVLNGRIDVQKTGRTTGYTQGQIEAMAFDGPVGYSSGDAHFVDQMLIRDGSFSAPGDSGSCILDLDENIVGLLFAGGATHTIANFIEDVWTLLPPIDFSDGIL